MRQFKSIFSLAAFAALLFCGALQGSATASDFEAADVTELASSTEVADLTALAAAAKVKVKDVQNEVIIEL